MTPVATQAPAATPSTTEQDLEKEVELIHRTAEKQLASVNGLNASLAKKILKSEAQTNALLEINKTLEAKNADLVTQLHKAQDDVRTLSIKEAELEQAEKKCAEATTAMVNAELLVKKNEARLDAVSAERDTIESELCTTRVQLEDTQRTLTQTKELHEADRQKHEEEINLLTTSHNRTLEEMLKDHQDKVSELNLLLTNANTEKQKSFDEANRNITAAEARVDEMKYENDAMLKQLEVVKKERDSVIDQRDELEKANAVLSGEVESLRKSVKDSETEHHQTRELLLQTEQSKEELNKETESKVEQLSVITASLKELTEEHEGLKSERDELSSSNEQLRKDLEQRQSELESKNLSFEGERNLLTSEKMSLEKDFADLREQNTTLKADRDSMEKRACELEGTEKRQLIKIKSLEQEKLALISTHEKELHERIAALQAQFELDTATLRKELDDVVDRYAAMHRAQVERENAATAVHINTSPEQKADNVIHSSANTSTTDVIDGNTTAKNVDRVIMEVPEAPMPYVASSATTGATTTTDGEDVHDDDDLVDGMQGRTALPRDVDAHGSRKDVKLSSAGDDVHAEGEVSTDVGSGDATIGIISEEVVEEEVVDDADEDNVLEEVDEEELIPEDEAAEKKKLALANNNSNGADVAQDVQSGEGANAIDERRGILANIISDGGHAQDVLTEAAPDILPHPSETSQIATAEDELRKHGQSRIGETQAQGMTETEEAQAVKGRVNDDIGGATNTDKPRRAGSRMLNRMICCVKVDSAEGHTSS